jgi:hypothetical protein
VSSFLFLIFVYHDRHHLFLKQPVVVRADEKELLKHIAAFFTVIAGSQNIGVALRTYFDSPLLDACVA